MAQGGYFYLIIEAIARVLAVLAFFSRWSGPSRGLVLHAGDVCPMTSELCARHGSLIYIADSQRFRAALGSSAGPSKFAYNVLFHCPSGSSPYPSWMRATNGPSEEATREAESNVDGQTPSPSIDILSFILRISDALSVGFCLSALEK